MHDAGAGTQSLIAFFDRAASRVPDRIAIDVPPSHSRPERVTVSYRELSASADRVASQLTPALPESSGDAIVAVLLPRTTPDLYAAQLGILRSGAAYVCFDVAFPDEYIARLLEDAAPRAVVTDGAGASRLARLAPDDLPIVDVGTIGENLVTVPPARIAPHDLAYVIYTSGTTGQPKGVMIEHASIVNLVASDIGAFDLNEHDRVAQGSSPAYDSSLEEIWLALAAGATVVVLDDQTIRLGPDLVGWIRDERITVLCPPPTLLRMMACSSPREQLPELRLLYVGGEALDDDVVSAWAPGRRMVNGYGPTECTVTVIRGDVVAGKPVTIGRAVEGNHAWVLDEQGARVAVGTEGALYIGGAGLARGYLNRPDATREKFISHPTLGRIYATGDLVRENADGDLEFLGRIDDQIKLRGYRIELGAVETTIAGLPGIAAAACAVRGQDASEVLVAFVVTEKPDDAIEPEAMRAPLTELLPVAMVPGRFVKVRALPTTVGGKLDRRALPEIGHEQSAKEELAQDDKFATVMQERIGAAMRDATDAGGSLTAQTDFFVDLGGDSLSAVAVVCSLRREQATEAVTTRDVYECRTIGALADRLERGDQEPEFVAGPVAGQNDIPYHRIVLATLTQGVAILIEFLLAGTVAWAAVFVVLPELLALIGPVALVMVLPLALRIARLGLGALTVGVVVTAKRMLIGKYTQQQHAVWSGFFVRHWLVMRIAGLIPWGMLSGTVFLNVVLRMLGARVGRRVHIHRGVSVERGGWDLLAIGDDVTLGQEVSLNVSELESGHICFGSISIGDRATLETRASLSRDTVVEDDAYVEALSWIPRGTTVASGEMHSGVPARKVGSAPLPPEISGRPMSEWAHGCALVLMRECSVIVTWVPYALALIVLGAMTGLDGAKIGAWLAVPTWSLEWIALIAALVALITPVSLIVRAFGLRWLAPVRASQMHRLSLRYIVVWMRTAEVEAAGRWLSGTLFWPIWLRLAGMRIGARSEISTIIDVLPERVSIGRESFFADGIYLGSPNVHRGVVTIRDTQLGNGTFLGNHVVVPGGAFPDDYFVGVCTVADGASAREHSAWFGHPRLELPHRNVVHADESITLHPSLIRVISRVSWETLRFAVPVLALLVAMAWYASVAALASAPAWQVGAGVFGATVAAGAIMCLAVVALKWILLGHSRPGQHALWSCWCSRWDFLYFAWQQWARAILVQLEGTLFLSMYLRAMGVEIGRRVVLGPGFAQVVDPDMLHFGDGATVSSLFQAHSFEDRVLKMNHVFIGAGATTGQGGVLFYGADIGERAWVAPCAVVMKNERIEASSQTVGVPAQTMRATLAERSPIQAARAEP